MDEVLQNVAFLDKTEANLDPRHTLKVLRTLPALRRRLDAAQLSRVLATAYSTVDPSHSAALTAALNLQPPPATETPVEPLRHLGAEADVYLHLVSQAWLLHSASATPAAVFELSGLVMQRLGSYNKRSLDYLVGKAWFYYVEAALRAGLGTDITKVAMPALRTAMLRHDVETQAVLVTQLLRVLVAQSRFAEAANVVAKVGFPVAAASNAVAARYYYYLARIAAVQLSYSTAHEQIVVAERKVPQTPAARGFMAAAAKLRIIVELLMGEIPERRTVCDSGEAYLSLARAVRRGDVSAFEQVLGEHETELKRDGNLTLARRLRQIVIKTGVRLLSLTYSRISLREVCLKLQLDSEETAEYMVAKAIRDGVIDAKIDHQRAYMQSCEVLDVYATSEPQEAFHERINFCMALHDESVKSMRYLTSNHRDDLKDVQEAREREKELVTEIQESTDPEDEDGDFDL